MLRVKLIINSVVIGVTANTTESVIKYHYAVTQEWLITS